jgi:hypothetical protein
VEKPTDGGLQAKRVEWKREAAIQSGEGEAWRRLLAGGDDREAHKKDERRDNLPPAPLTTEEYGGKSERIEKAGAQS